MLKPHVTIITRNDKHSYLYYYTKKGNNEMSQNAHNSLHTIVASRENKISLPLQNDRIHCYTFEIEYQSLMSWLVGFKVLNTTSSFIGAENRTTYRKPLTYRH